MDNRAIQRGGFQLLEAANAHEPVIGFERTDAGLGCTLTLVNLGEGNAEVSFGTDAFVHVDGYRQVRVISTGFHRSPPFELSPGGITVLIGGLPAARVGDMVTCVGPPDVIVLGSFKVLIKGQPAARMGDLTAHGGTIILGYPKVLIN